MPETVPLSDWIGVRGRFLRSTHLERDFRSDSPGSYYLTESVYNLLKAISRAFDQPSQRAMTLVGPYGSGKSAFCAYLGNLLERRQSSAPLLSELDKVDAELRSCLAHRPPLLPVFMVGSRQPLGSALVTGLLRSLEQGGYTRLRLQLMAEAAETLACPIPSARQVADLYELAACLAGKLEGAGGLLVMIDELGKFLEHAAQHPHEGDIFTLQELAEAACRSRDSTLVVIGVLHQNADVYAQKLGKTYQAEWAKVGERFCPLPFFPSDVEHIEMAARALEHRSGIMLTEDFDHLIQRCADLNLTPPGLKPRFLEKARAAYPLHPVTLLALPALLRRTGQSQRSLFTLLSGEEPHAFQRFLRETPFTPEDPPLFPPDRLFDYAAETLAGGWGASSVARQWAEAMDLVERAENVTPEAHRLLKCIGLLGILHDPRLRANEATLTLCLMGADGGGPNVKEALCELTRRQLISYSRSRDSYRLWEGGDVDVEAELARARMGTQAHSTLRVAQELCPPPRLIARRHSYVTGTLRAVQVLACDANQLESAIAQAGKNLTLLLCLAQNSEEREQAERRAVEATQKNLLIGLAQETDLLREVAADVVAAHRVEKETPALAGDRAARRELAARRYEAETEFQEEWNRRFGAQDGEAAWFYEGNPHPFAGAKAFFAFLSEMADRSYYHAPRLRNELINRRQLSSAAAAGRRNLIEAMLMREVEPRLGFHGAPPELSMYECVLRATGLHREVEDGIWAFVEPEEENPSRLRPCWEALANRIFADPPAPRPVTALYEDLCAPPYGLTEGVLPVLLCAFLQAHREETTLYREGTFLPDPGVADFEVLLRRPELFSVAGARLTGERAMAVQRLAERLRLPPYVVTVVRALLKMVKGLPEYAWKTRRLPETVLAMREAFSRAKSPEQLLFHDLPLALQVTFFAQEDMDEARVESFFTALNAALQTWGQALPRAMETARHQLLEACGLPTGETGWAELRHRATALEGSVAHPMLLPFIRCAAEAGDDLTVLEKALAQVANRPPRTWTDMDTDRFGGQAQALGELFRAAVAAVDHPVMLAPAPNRLTADEVQHSQQVATRLRAQLAREPFPPHILHAALVSLLDGLNA